MRANLIAALTGVVIAAAALPPPPTAHAEPTKTTIDDYVAEAVHDTGLPGLSVVVTHRDRVVHAAGYGQDAMGVPITADTPMRIASVSKSFTAVAVMTLVEDGRIALDVPVADQLPGFTMADSRHTGVTVRHLLNQTSGFSDTTIDIGALERASSLAQYTSALGSASLTAAPGTRYEYCNVNYDVAARLVEVASGRPFGDYLKERVFGPLGMSRSTVSSQEIKPANGYNSVFGAWLSRHELPGFLDSGGSGGVITTAADMGKWLISQTGNGAQLVSPGGLRTTHTSSTVDDYAMGWMPETGPDGGELLVHPGNLFTYTAVQAVVPGSGYGFAVMANSASLYDDTYDILTGLVALSQGRQPEDIGGGRQLVELVLGLIALVAVGLGALGVWRSRGWAARRAGTAPWRVALRLVPSLLPSAVFAAYPDLISTLMNGRTVTWNHLTYFAVPLTITLLAAALSGVTAAITRLIRLRSVTSVR